MYISERFPVIVPSIGEGVLWRHLVYVYVLYWVRGEAGKKYCPKQPTRVKTCRFHGYDVEGRQYFEGSTTHPCLQRELATASRD